MVEGTFFCIITIFFYFCQGFTFIQFHQIMTHSRTEWDESSNNYKLFIAHSRGIQMFLETLLLESEVAFQEEDIDVLHILIQPLRL